MSDLERWLKRWEAAAGVLRWESPWEAVYRDDRPEGSWFVGGTLSAALNCIDRHAQDRPSRVAIRWEGEPGDQRTITYGELQTEVVAFAEALRSLSVSPGDRVALYMGWIPETVVAILACARVGAVHVLLPSALPADALADRLADVRPKIVVTQDGAWRHGMILPLKSRIDEALAAVSSVEQTVVARRTGVELSWFEGDRWYHELVAGAAEGKPRPPEIVPADHPLFITHLASRRGRPAAVVHRTGGFLAYAATLHQLGLTLTQDDVFWCAVDIGWVAGQTHGIYGPLVSGATVVMYEGTLDTPTHERTWQIIARYGVNSFFTSPSVVRNLRRWVDSPPKGGGLDTLRLIVTGGEPIDEQTRAWLSGSVGGGHAIVADAWGQTELGGIVTVTPSPHGEGSLPDPGLDVVDPAGKSVPAGIDGQLVLRQPWPACFLSIESDEGPAAADYFTPGGPAFATGDSARREADGSLVIIGRGDPVVKVSAQLVSLTEVGQVLEEHPFVQAAEAIEQPDPRSGHHVVACVVLEAEVAPSDELARDIRSFIHDTLGGLASPHAVVFVESFPETLSPEVRRQALRALCATNPSETMTVTTAQLVSAASATAI